MPPPLRRNGKQQACEPCRKGKLACDHAAPFCGRCVRRKITARCIYHPAPMTRKKVPPEPGPGPSPGPVLPQQLTPSNSTDRSNHIFSPSQSSEVFSTPFRPDLNAQETPRSSVPDVPDARNPGAKERNHGNGKVVTPAFRRTARYYGPTSFSAIFSEHADLSEGLLDVGDDGRDNSSAWPLGVPLLGNDSPSSPAVRMSQVIKALENLPSKEICFSLIDTPKNTHISMNIVLIRHAIETLWATFEPNLAAPRTTEKLAGIAEVLFANELRPFPPAPDDGMDWLNTFMGPNLRFEMLGMLFCFFGMAYQSLNDWDERFKVPENQGRDRKQTSWRMKECADVCLKMNETSEENNDISLALQVCTAILESVCTGDESLQLRRRHGDIIVCTIAAGLHRLPDYGSHKITAASEYKRRLFSSIYGSDKNHAFLNGIPPALSARFCNLCLPLDIGEEELFLPQRELVTVISKLDHNGWNTAGELHKVTARRAFHLLSGIREEILELSLGVNVQLSASRVEDLHRRCQAVYDALPPQLHYYAHDKIPKDCEGKHLTGRAYLMLNFLQNSFLIDRVAIARGLPNEQGLLDTAMEMMDVTITFWIKRDQVMHFSPSFDWIITYGIPSAGVICVELLRQVASRHDLRFSRSDAIQKLTLFIGFLEWIRPTDGNYMLAGRLKRVIRRILDHVLDPLPKETTGHDFMDVPIDPMLAPFGEVDWVNTIDWAQGSWMDFN